MKVYVDVHVCGVWWDGEVWNGRFHDLTYLMVVVVVVEPRRIALTGRWIGTSGRSIAV